MAGKGILAKSNISLKMHIPKIKTADAGAARHWMMYADFNVHNPVIIWFAGNDGSYRGKNKPHC